MISVSVPKKIISPQRMSTVDISGINKEELLQALWTRSKPATYFSHSGSTPPTFNFSVAKQELSNDGYADYICGRAIKTNIYLEETVDPYMYDRDAGTGAFQEVVNQIREKNN